METYNIPTGLTLRLEFSRNAVDRCITNATAWGIPETLIGTITTRLASYERKHSVAANTATRSQTAIADRDGDWVPLLESLDELYTQHLLYNSDLSAAEKVALHINQLGGTGASPTPARDTTPIVSLVAEEISVLHVVYADSANQTSHSKPAGVAFCELWAKIDGAAPASPADCTLRYNISRTHEGIVFEPGARGKTVYGYARWVNKNGKTGPLSSVFSAIIP
ncbi:MAG: hypothetical protein ABIX01_14425 [Chitinophagaceae bacterium]